MGGESATHAWRGVTAGVVLVTGGLWAWFIADLITPASVLVPLLVGLAGLLGAAALGGAAALVVRLLRVRIVPGHVVWAVVAALPLLNLMTRGGLSSAAHLLVVLVVVGASALAGGAIALVAAGGWRRRTPSARVAVGLALVAGAGTLLAGAALLAWSGPGADREPVAPERALAAGDPFAPGPYGVRRLTYGSGTDRHRPEFAEGAALRTRPVDGSGVVEGWSGVGGRMRTDFWGFGPSDLPLDGRVWYPAAKGRFPLVLVVHGDHLASDFSDGGYAYLGERLASRGFIVASVDENFLNSADGDLSAIGVSRFGLQDDMEARAWLLLQHLRAWRAWNDRPGNPFSGRVDLGRIGLVGHSRGGEAVAAATVLNRRPGYGFAIRAVGAIAPTDDTFRPAGRPVALDGVDYLALAGSADGDVLSFGGADQYRRTTLRAGDFKAAVLVDRANHSQFNTTWGRYDSGYGAARRLLGTKALLAPADERRVAGVFVSAFLDASLRGRRGALRLLRDPGAGGAWLPDTVILKHFADAETRSLMRGGVTAIEWDGPKAFTVAPAAPSRSIGPGGELVFSLADTGPASDPIDLTVELTDGDGTVARMPLSASAPLEPELTTRHLKIGALEEGPAGEPAFQTYALALADWARRDPRFDPATLRRVRFVFDRTRAGRILLGDVGVRDRTLPGGA